MIVNRMPMFLRLNGSQSLRPKSSVEPSRSIKPKTYEKLIRALKIYSKYSSTPKLAEELLEELKSNEA